MCASKLMAKYKSSEQNMIEYLYSNMTSTKIKRLKKIRKGAWIRMFSPDETDLKFLKEEIGLERDEVFESLDLFEVPRIEKAGDNILIFLRTPGQLNDKGRIRSDTLLLVISEKHIVTIATNKNQFIQKVQQNKDLITTQRTKFVLEIIHSLVEEYTDNILAIHHKVQRRFTVEREVSDKDIKLLLEYEQLANLYQSALAPMVLLADQISTGKMLKIFIEDEELLIDVKAEASQALDIANVTRKLIVSLRDSYQIIFTNTLNNNVQLLAGLTIALTIPTIISGLWGMNVPIPFANNQFAFTYIFGGAIALAIIIFVIFKKKRWV